MAKTTGASGNGLLYFIAGLLVAGVVGFGIYHFTEGDGAKNSADFEISVSENGIRVDEN